MSLHIYRSIDVDVDVEIDIDDILKFLSSATKKEKEQIISTIIGEDMVISADNFYDREKISIFKKAMNKYNIEQLLEKLDIKQHEV